jgi:hypothetical protein
MGDDPTLDWNYVLGGGDEPTYTTPVFPVVGWSEIKEPPPAGYPKVIVHPDRPNSPFVLASPGWYRSPTNELVSYQTVAEYVLTAQSASRADLLRILGQSGATNVWLYVAGAVGAVVLIALLTGR